MGESMVEPTAGDAPRIVRATQWLEETDRVDGAVGLLEPVAERLVSDTGRRKLLQGHWVGHSIHPLLTDMPIGMWTSATVLDLFGGASARPAARRLVAAGVLAAVPTAVTGLAEWAGAETRERRVGVVHAAANGTSLALYVASWAARRRHRHAFGAGLALAGALATTVGGYLGAHLVEVRKVSSRHPAFAETGTDAPFIAPE